MARLPIWLDILRSFAESDSATLDVGACKVYKTSAIIIPVFKVAAKQHEQWRKSQNFLRKCHWFRVVLPFLLFLLKCSPNFAVSFVELTHATNFAKLRYANPQYKSWKISCSLEFPSLGKSSANQSMRCHRNCLTFAWTNTVSPPG